MRLATLPKRRAAVLWLLATAALVVGCSDTETTPSTSPPTPWAFDDEFALAVRAGRDQVSDEEKQQLLEENHPLLAQIGDPNTSKLIRLFAQLPDEAHTQLKADGYVKWQFTSLGEGRQQVVRELIQINIDMAEQQGAQPQPGLSMEALESSQVGFAVVEIAEGNQKVVSWFVLWPELPNPTWVTVVNARAAGTQPYFQAHLARLPLLKPMPQSKTLP